MPVHFKTIVRKILRRIVSPSVINAVRSDSLTYLSKSALQDLHNHVTRLESKKADGLLIEAGCALGGSAIVIATAKSKERPFHIYDVFGMIPPPSDKDGQDVHRRYATIADGAAKGLGKGKYYGYEENLISKVTYNFKEHNVPIKENNIHLIKGRFQDTMQIQEPVALAHIDGDWYESVTTCLQRIEPNLIPGGVLVIDDYGCWSGCRTAVDEYFENKKDSYEFIERERRLHIIKRNESGVKTDSTI